MEIKVEKIILKQTTMISKICIYSTHICKSSAENHGYSTVMTHFLFLVRSHGMWSKVDLHI